MRVSVFLGFQGGDWLRSEGSDGDERVVVRDGQVYADNISIADLLEPLGFDALFQVEHHGSPYHMTSNPLAILYYMAGRTERLEMGTCVVVLPWNNPLRVAEEISVLDNMLQGRQIHIGVGRGSSPSEYQYLGIDQSEASERFKEGVDILRLALRTEEFSYEGTHYHVSDVTTRPRPWTPSLGEHIYGALVSKPSLDVVARMGLDLMCTGGTSIETMTENCGIFNDARASIGLSPTRPIVAVPAYCAATEDEASEVAERAFGSYIEGSRRHYGFDQPQQFANIKGYEQYGPGGGGNMRGGDSPRDDYLRSGIFGTPDQCIQKMRTYADVTGTDHILMLHAIAGMSVRESEQSLRLFSREVLPVVRPEHSEAAAARL
ncbi:MAG: Luciferase-like, subgroup [Acidimicrobiales bacterium]|jgi:alkanesulfonate monooxygenase SsuD/methylene tetrahydromethanopterin reductase-like flavin-dependent oxidoreductase (luciferase family)|nr:Luciferase-like, subgroup [Acidimicrobiales bacterium]